MVQQPKKRCSFVDKMESHYEILVIEVVQCQIGKLAKMDEEKDLELFSSEYKQINVLLFNVIATKKCPDFVVHCGQRNSQFFRYTFFSLQ